MKPSIVPAIIAHENKRVAILNWENNRDQQIIKGMQKGYQIFSHAQFDIADTPHGKMFWNIFFIDLYKNLRDNDKRLFYFDLMFTPNQVVEPFFTEWFDLIHAQGQLNLYVTIDGIQRHHPMLRSNQIPQWYEAVKSWCEYTKFNSLDHTKAHFWLYKYKLGAILQNTEIDLKSHSNLHKKPIDALTSTFNEWMETRNFDDNEKQKYQYTLSMFVDRYKSTKSIQLPVAKIDNEIKWQSISIPPVIKNEWQFLIARLLPNYTNLLNGLDWSIALEPDEIVAQAIHELTISSLSKVPSSQVYNGLNSIIQSGIDDHEYTIDRPSSIIIDKQGLKEIIYYPIDNLGLTCLVKFVLGRGSEGTYNLVMLGYIDSQQGTIEIVGDYDNKVGLELQILKFLATIGYRDLLICRNILTVSTSKKSTSPGIGFNATKPKHSPKFEVLPRIKYIIDSHNNRQFSPTFANPDAISLRDADAIADYITKIKPHLRRYHKRRLPQGMNPSDTALSLAEQYNCTLPQGYTFVSPTCIGDSDAIKVRAEFKSISLLQAIVNK